MRIENWFCGPRWCKMLERERGAGKRAFALTLRRVFGTRITTNYRAPAPNSNPFSPSSDRRSSPTRRPISNPSPPSSPFMAAVSPAADPSTCRSLRSEWAARHPWANHVVLNDLKGSAAATPPLRCRWTLWSPFRSHPIGGILWRTWRRRSWKRPPNGSIEVGAAVMGEPPLGSSFPTPLNIPFRCSETPFRWNAILFGFPRFWSRIRRVLDGSDLNLCKLL